MSSNPGWVELWVRTGSTFVLSRTGSKNKQIYTHHIRIFLSIYTIYFNSFCIKFLNLWDFKLLKRVSQPQHAMNSLPLNALYIF